jgi:hypothetical protein
MTVALSSPVLVWFEIDVVARPVLYRAAELA